MYIVGDRKGSGGSIIRRLIICVCLIFDDNIGRCILRRGIGGVTLLLKPTIMNTAFFWIVRVPLGFIAVERAIAKMEGRAVGVEIVTKLLFDSLEVLIMSDKGRGARLMNFPLSVEVSSSRGL